MAKRNIAGFFRYARARHQVYLNRMAGKAREEWTKDPILQQYRFTNVFRELDKTTVWFREHFRDKWRDDPRVLLGTVTFRLLNRIEVGEAIFSQSDMFDVDAFNEFAHGGDVRVLRRAIRANCGDGPYVTGAYIISSPPGMSKLDGVLDVIKKFTWSARHKFGGWRNLADNMRDNRWSLEQAHECLRQFDYFGPFHAYEIVTDLRHTSLLDRAPDIMTWANPGPGARRGLNRTFGRDKSAPTPRSQLIDEMRILLSWSRDPKYWPQDDKKNWPSWEMRDVEHQSCEWDKYCRVLNGEGKPRGVYR